jgi:hypothetical protein
MPVSKIFALLSLSVCTGLGIFSFQRKFIALGDAIQKKKEKKKEYSNEACLIETEKLP